MESLLVNILNGIAFGMILFLIASGLSVIYGFMGVLNLAHGVFYILGAYFGLIVCSYNMSFVLSAIAGGIAVGLIGLILERIFLSRVYKQINEQVLLTLGFVYIFSNIVRWVWGPYAKLIAPPAFASGSINIIGATFPLYRLVIIFMGLGVAAGLWLLNNKTRAGSILRAGMDDREMTVGLGVNYALVATIVFVLGAFVGGFAGFIGLPIIAVHPGIVFDILLLSLIVIIVGGVGRIEGVLLGATIIGLIDSLGRAYFPEFAYFTMYTAMIIILLVKPTGLLGRYAIKTEDADVNTTRHAWPQGTPYHVPCILVGLALILSPSFVPLYLQGIMTKALIFVIFATSLNILSGYTGLFSLGHAAFFGIGAYTSSIIMVHYSIKSFWLVAPAGILMAVFFASILGIIALRVSGTQFFLVTLALGQLLYSIAIKWKSMTGGTNGLVNTHYPDLGLARFPMNATSFYYLVLGISVISLCLLYLVTKSPLGVALQGIRESELRMRALGYNTWLFKYIAFIIGGAFAGVAGVLFAYHSKVLIPMHLGVTTSTLVMLMVIIGSDRAFLGPAVGALVIVFLEHYSSLYAPERWPLILGTIFVIAVMFLRGGIYIYLPKIWRKVSYASAEH